ncbi:DNA primase [Lentibacillus sp. JNUCC-1]|uniref:DNA primase n=1 Tax=Lentibacillus sp. JNUCC-1 TaxID=2654513 RepID=UPI0012E90FA7|nr:DNA primase [Lentibacillus sp. JNUCC-1]MUV39613.1 DNA primase [Lentibacillus sp. JNUCC-1]
MSKRISDEVIENVRNNNEIVDVIGEYVQLKKQGKNYFGLCPFHGEKTPSFSVNQDKQIFHCFGCGKGGNVFTFLMELEGYTFYEVLVQLAERSDIELPEQVTEKQQTLPQADQNILMAHEWLAKLYHHLLMYTKDGREGLEYFKKRGIHEETINLFQLGFAPNVSTFTVEFLEKKGFHQQELIKAGLVSEQEDGRVTDRFRGRIMIPIRNHLGKPIAFGGRAIGQQEPKYLNSPESDLFQKGRMLFNFDLAKRDIRKQNEVVLFEGYMDVLSAYQANVRNALATLGTSLTEHQARLLKRYTDTVILCYDQDKAGQDGAYRAATLLRQSGCDVKVAKMPDNMDPDDYIRSHGGEAFKKHVIAASDTFTHFYMQYAKKDFNLNIQGDRIEYIEHIVSYLATIESRVEREYYLKELSSDFHVSMDTLLDEIKTKRETARKHEDKRENNRYTNRAVRIQQEKKLLPAFHNAERQLIAHMLSDETIAFQVQEELGAAFNIDAHKVLVTHLYAYYEKGNPAEVSLFMEHIEDDQLRQLVAEITMMPIFDQISSKEIQDYINMIKAKTHELEHIAVLKQDQRIAEQQNDPIKAAQIAMQIIQMQKPQ